MGTCPFPAAVFVYLCKQHFNKIKLPDKWIKLLDKIIRIIDQIYAAIVLVLKCQQTAVNT